MTCRQSKFAPAFSRRIHAGRRIGKHLSSESRISPESLRFEVKKPECCGKQFRNYRRNVALSRCHWKQIGSRTTIAPWAWRRARFNFASPDNSLEFQSPYAFRSRLEVQALNRSPFIHCILQWTLRILCMTFVSVQFVPPVGTSLLRYDDG